MGEAQINVSRKKQSLMARHISRTRRLKKRRLNVTEGRGMRCPLAAGHGCWAEPASLLCHASCHTKIGRFYRIFFLRWNREYVVTA
jgi:hypothetical protein